MKINRKALTIKQIKKIFELIGNSYEANNMFCNNMRLPIVSTILDVFCNTEVEVLSVVDHRRSSWGKVYTVENIKELEDKGTKFECIKAIRTFSDHIDVKIENVVAKKQIHATLIVWESGMRADRMSGKRVTIKFKLEEKYLKQENIRDCILGEYQSHLEEKYANYLEEQKLLWMMNMHNSLIQQ